MRPIRTYFVLPTPDAFSLLELYYWLEWCSHQVLSTIIKVLLQDTDEVFPVSCCIPEYYIPK